MQFFTNAFLALGATTVAAHPALAPPPPVVAPPAVAPPVVAAPAAASPAVAAPAVAAPALATKNVPVGTLIYKCTVPGTVAITFDDGPSIYTSQLLDTLSQYGAKATFFIVGSGYRGNIDNQQTHWPGIIRRIHAEGHQVASHTWTHADLSRLSRDGMSDELVNNEIAFSNILGFMPTYFRAPYLSCNDACMNLLAEFGYKIIDTDLDTKDYLNTTPDTVQYAKNNFDEALRAGGSLALAHDIHEQTVVSLTPHMLDTLLAKGLKAVTVGECLGDDVSGWYRKSR